MENSYAIKLTSLKFIITAFLIFVPKLSTAASLQTQCPDIVNRGHINVLTINLLFSEGKDREIRLENIADFIIQQAEEGEPVDIVLLQEVVGGTLPGTINSSMDLKELLTERGVNYNLRYQPVNGLPGILTVGNAILSRCEIVFTLAHTLPFATEEPFGKLVIPLKRKVIMSRIHIPDYGSINFYNTHLCSFCDPTERFEQALALFEFIDNVETFIEDENPVILGGDFNINMENPNDLPVYELITRHHNFVDTYAAFNNCTDCCSDNEGYDGCTFAVFGNVYATNLFTGQPEEPARIDYLFFKDVFAFGKDIFEKETELSIKDSSVIFNTEPWVSDHSGVLTKIGIP